MYPIYRVRLAFSEVRGCVWRWIECDKKTINSASFLHESTRQNLQFLLVKMIQKSLGVPAIYTLYDLYDDNGNILLAYVSFFTFVWCFRVIFFALFSTRHFQNFCQNFSLFCIEHWLDHHTSLEVWKKKNGNT